MSSSAGGAGESTRAHAATLSIDTAPRPVRPGRLAALTRSNYVLSGSAWDVRRSYDTG
jgi:hypothetical protein